MGLNSSKKLHVKLSLPGVWYLGARGSLSHRQSRPPFHFSYLLPYKKFCTCHHCILARDIYPQKVECPLKNSAWKTTFFRGHVSFLGCILSLSLKVMFKTPLRLGYPILGPPLPMSFPDHSHTSRDSYGSVMGLVWVAGGPTMSHYWGP